MPRPTGFLASTALALVLTAPAAFADLTAAQAWGDWRDYMQGMGYNLTATENASGNQLKIDDIKVNMQVGDKGGSMTMTMGGLTFVENGDGTVDVVFPQTVPINIRLAPPSDNPPAVIDMSYTHAGMKMTMSGTPQDLTYNTNAESVTMSLDGISVDGQKFGAETAKFIMTIAGFESLSNMKIGNLRTYVQKMSASDVSYDMFIRPPEENQTIAMKGQVASLAFEGGGDIPNGIGQIAQSGDMQAMLDAGFSVDGDFSFGAGSSDVKMKDPQTDAQIQSSSSGGTFGVRMGKDGLGYEATQQDVSMSMQVAGFPFPIAMQMASAGFGLQMPITQSETAQDFGLAMNFTGFTMADALWGLFDPAGQLPRDPATIDVDVSGKAKMLVNLMDPKEAEAMAASGKQPGELEALSINKLIVQAVGAALTGSGSVTFDNSDKQTYAGMPKPVGGVDLKLVGGNALIDKLVAMGFVPEEQAMGARMMMGLFAVPGDTPDTLTSKIEFNDQGQILANGQRIK